MKRSLWLGNCAMGVVALLGPAVGAAGARGFSRESPATGGGLSSRGGSAHERQGSAQMSRPQTPSSMQTSHQQYASSAQANREQTATGMQSSRERTATEMPSSAQQYHGSYYHAASSYPAWDAGAGLAAATTGAAIGAAAASSRSAPPAQVYVASLPCGEPDVIPVGSTTYFRCGSSWYAQGYGPNGPTFVVIAPPPGY
jgi:hypothetical protein